MTYSLNLITCTQPWFGFRLTILALIKIGSKFVFIFLAIKKGKYLRTQEKRKTNVEEVLPHLVVSLVAAASCASYRP